MKLFQPGKFFVGCNFWAHHAGIAMWSNWDEKALENDFKQLSGAQMEVLRVFPLWSEFQPITRFYNCKGLPGDYGMKGKLLQTIDGVDETMLRRFGTLCDLAEKYHIQLIVALITGWMSGRLFVPPALEGKNPVTDPEALQWEVRYVRRLVRKFKTHPAIAAWDLGNECNCLGEADAAQSWCWLNAITSAIRLEDNSRPVISGMHGLSGDQFSPWNLSFQGELADVTTTHPYPLFTPHCNSEPFDAMRSALHASAESRIYRGLSGKPCFPEECGSLGPMVASEKAAAAQLRVSLWECWAENLCGMLPWCAYDQTHLDYPPYAINHLEQELGLFRADGAPKEQAKILSEFSGFLKTLPFDTLPPRKVDAICLLSQRQSSWEAGFGAALLAKQAGFEIEFAGVEDDLPDSPCYILPALDGFNAITRDAWLKVRKKVHNGARLLLTIGGDTVLSQFRETTGVAIEARYQSPHAFEIDLGGEKISVQCDHTTKLQLERVENILSDTDGNPVMTTGKYGSGEVTLIPFALEKFALQSQPSAFYGADLNPRYLLYRRFAKACGFTAVARKTSPLLGITEHRLDAQRVAVVAINFDSHERIFDLNISGKVQNVFNGSYQHGKLSLRANDGAVLIVEA